VDGLLKKGGVQSAQKYLDQGETLLKEGKLEDAVRTYAQLMEMKNLKAEGPAKAGLVRCALKGKDIEMAKQLVDDIKQNHQSDLTHPEVKKALAAMELAMNAAPAGEELQQLIDKVKQNPTDQQARNDLAVSYFQSGKHELAIEQCFEMIKQNKRWKEEAARQLLMKIFDALGPSDPKVKEARRKFSNIWFV